MIPLFKSAIASNNAPLQTNLDSLFVTALQSKVQGSKFKDYDIKCADMRPASNVEH
jgi:hypothetical protein